MFCISSSWGWSAGICIFEPTGGVYSMVSEQLFHGVGEPSRFWVGVLVSVEVLIPDFLFADFSNLLFGDVVETEDVVCVGNKAFNGLKLYGRDLLLVVSCLKIWNNCLCFII